MSWNNFMILKKKIKNSNRCMMYNVIKEIIMLLMLLILIDV